MIKKKPLIGFIGQGWIGRNYADDFEERGFDVVRYALEEPYISNKKKVADCDIVFIAVPTPTNKDGFDDSIIRGVLGLIGNEKIAVIKSTILPGTTESLQKKFSNIFIVHSPEFLTEATAPEDARNPDRNIIGLPVDNKKYRGIAKSVHEVLPKAQMSITCSSKEAELIKYGGNSWFYIKVVFINMLYDLAQKHSANFDVIKEGLSGDPRIGSTHLNPIHKSGRGAGGNCFIKDFAAFRSEYEKMVGDNLGTDALRAFENKNIDLLLSSEKDISVLKEVYGKSIADGRENI